MTEIIADKWNETQKKTSEELKNHEKKIDDWVEALKKNSKKQKERNNEELKDKLIDETFSGLEGKVYKKWKIIKFDFKWEPCSFNVNEQTIEYKWSTYEINMYKWANLDSVEFNNWVVNITWSIWWFSWEWKTSYTALYNALENVFETWHVEIATGDWESLKINKKA